MRKDKQSDILEFPKGDECMSLYFLLMYIPTGILNIMTFNKLFKKYKEDYLDGKCDLNNKELIKLFIIDLIPFINMMYATYLEVNFLNDSSFIEEKFIVKEDKTSNNINNIEISSNENKEDIDDEYNFQTNYIPHKVLKRDRHKKIS